MLQKKIMVVDDDTDILKVVSIILKGRGYDVVVLTTGRNFLAHVVDIKPNLILLDVQLGDIDGRMLCSEIKAIEAYDKIPVILFSANTHYATDIKSYLCDDFIAKPFEMESLIKSIARYI
jgi:DNA-binding response OmpR family regulator